MKIFFFAFAIFIVAVFISIPGKGLDLWRRLRLTGLVCLGAGWASSIALYVLAFEAAYEKFLLLPLCNRYSLDSTIFDAADLHLPSNENLFWNSSYKNIECLKASLKTNLADLVGSTQELLLSSVGALVTIVGTLVLWVVLTYLVLRAVKPYLWGKK